MRRILKMSIVAIAIILFGCNSSSHGNNNEDKIRKLVNIDATSTMPVVNGNNTKGINEEMKNNNNDENQGFHRFQFLHPAHSRHCQRQCHFQYMI